MTPKQLDYYNCVKQIISLTNDFKSGYELYKLIGTHLNQLVTGRCDSLVKNGLLEVKYVMIKNKNIKHYRRKIAEYTVDDYEKSIERKKRSAYEISRQHLIEKKPRAGVTVHYGDMPYTPEYLSWAKNERKNKRSGKVQANCMDYGSF